MDIRLYKQTGEFVDPAYTVERMERSVLSEAPVNPLETIAGKVIKFFLTTRGTDALDPTFGSYLKTYTQISESLVPRLHIELLEDTRRCAQFIRNAELGLSNTTEKFDSLVLVSLDYDRLVDPGKVTVRFEIKTTRGNYSLLQIPVTTNG